MRDFTLDLVKGNLTAEEAEDLLKAKYDRRWRGPDGKWRYEYKKPGKKRSKRSKRSKPAPGEHEGHAIAAMDERKVRAKLESAAQGLKADDQRQHGENIQWLVSNRDMNDRWLDYAADALGVYQTDQAPSSELFSAAVVLRDRYHDAFGLKPPGRWYPEDRPQRPVSGVWER